MRQWCKTCKTPIQAEVAEPTAKAGVRPTRKPVQTPRHHKGPENDPQEGPEGQIGTNKMPKKDHKTARDPQKTTQNSPSGYTQKRSSRTHLFGHLLGTKWAPRGTK